MKELKDGLRSLVRIDFRGHVHKQFRGTDSDKRFANEVAVLKALEDRGATNVPRLVGHDPETLTLITTNCGSPAPLITLEKAQVLFQELENKFGIRHDDPEPRNVTYSPHLGKFCLIDFELSEILPIPSELKACKTNVLRANWAASSIKGNGHLSNDDSFITLTVNPKSTDPLPKSGEILLDPSHLVLAVSDGMGGHNAGEFASRLLMSRIRKEAAELYHQLGTSEDAQNALDALLRQCHHDVTELAKQNGNTEGMGATLTMAWISHSRLFWAHIGDSRLYLIDNEGVRQLTQDDCRAWHQWQRGDITEYAYRNHPRRSVLTDVLGGSSHEPFPKTGSLPLKDTQRIMICSDGIMDGLWEDTIRNMLTEQKSVPETMQNLSYKAIENDDKDDTTLIVAEISRI
ncbi:MAG: protein phosphatase 2C domain-containing protein [Akkermansiaceae bacterium]|nr:protein phosphatase 2C domain-containing protein [Akkermansiaceae bacterium]